jgi:ribosome maturation factor RimP
LGTTHSNLAIERTVTGLNYELVDVERSAAGLLRVFIDRAVVAGTGDHNPEPINVEDCERVTRQLQYALEVEGVAYERLEVSSPGLDRPLKRPADYERFAGQEVNLTLKLPFKGRKNYRGQLLRGDAGWRLALNAGSDKKAAGAEQTEQALDFTLDEVREARLVPVIDFKGRARKVPGTLPAANAQQGVDGGHSR